MSGSASKIAITLDVNDLATKQIEQLQAQIAKLQTPAERAAKGIKGLTDPDGLGKLAAGMRNVSRDSLSAFENIGRTVAPLSMITSAASIAGLAALSREWARMGNQIGNSAQRAGTSVDHLTQFQNAAKLSGASAESATTGMTALNDAIYNAASGKDGGKAALAFNQVGISLKDLVGPDGHLRSAADLLPRVAHGLASIKNPTLQHNLGDMIFGGSADELMPTFRQFDTVMRQAQATGADWTKQMADNATAVNSAWARLGEDVEASFNRIENDWSGTVTKMLTASSRFMESNPKLVDSIEEIGTAVVSLSAIKPAAWVLGILGLDNPVTPLAAAAGLSAYATYLNGQNSASAQNVAAQQGYTRVASFDPDGVTPAAFTNPTTGDTRSAMSFDPRYNPGFKPTAMTTTQQKANAAAMSAELAKQGYTKEGIAAILGSGMIESGLNPTATNGSHGGIFQWDAERQAAIQQQFGKSVTSLSATESADAAAWELKNNPRFASLNNQLMTSHNLRLNNFGVTTQFEAPGNYETEVPTRLGASQNILASLPDAPPANIQGGTGTAPAAGSDTTVKGSADLRVTLNGFPQGTQTQATTEGDLFSGAPRIVQAMPLGMQP